MKYPEDFSDEAVNKRSMQATKELEVASRSAKVKRELDNAAMDKKERRPMKEFSELREELVNENIGVSHSSMPPNILILRRKTVRQFPNNTMVALYYNDKLKQYFSIPYGAGIDAVVNPVSIQEADKLMKEEHLNEVGPQEFYEDHEVGDEVHYRSGEEAHLRVGKVKKVESDHLVVHRDGYNYKVPHEKVVHNERTGYRPEHMTEETSQEKEVLNEISISTANRAYHERQKRGEEALAKHDYKTAVPHFRKAMKTVIHRAKKYSRADRGEVVRESEMLNESVDPIQSLRNIVSPKDISTPATKETRRKGGLYDPHIHHDDGTKTHIDHVTASALLTVHKNLKPEHQTKFADQLKKSRGHLLRMVDFAWKHVK